MRKGRWDRLDPVSGWLSLEAALEREATRRVYLPLKLQLREGREKGGERLQRTSPREEESEKREMRDQEIVSPNSYQKLFYPLVQAELQGP